MKNKTKENTNYVAEINSDDKDIKKDKEIRYVELQGKKYKVLRKENNDVLIEVDIVNSKGIKEKFKQWYNLDILKIVEQ